MHTTGTAARLAATALTVLLLLSGCEEAKKQPSREKPTETAIPVPKKPEYYAMQSVQGEIIRAKPRERGVALPDINATLALVSVFATWCPPCRAEIPHLVRLQDKYRSRMQIIGFSIEPSADAAALLPFMERHGINYMVIPSAQNRELLTKLLAMLNQPHNFTIPLMVLFKNGDYFRHYVGMVPEEMLESDIKKALKEQ